MRPWLPGVPVCRRYAPAVLLLRKGGVLAKSLEPRGEGPKGSGEDFSASALAKCITKSFMRPLHQPPQQRGGGQSRGGGGWGEGEGRGESGRGGTGERRGEWEDRPEGGGEYSGSLGGRRGSVGGGGTSGREGESEDGGPLVLVFCVETLDSVALPLRRVFTHEIAITAPTEGQRTDILHHLMCHSRNPPDFQSSHSHSRSHSHSHSTHSELQSQSTLSQPHPFASFPPPLFQFGFTSAGGRQGLEAMAARGEPGPSASKGSEGGAEAQGWMACGSQVRHPSCQPPP